MTMTKQKQQKRRWLAVLILLSTTAWVEAATATESALPLAEQYEQRETEAAPDPVNDDRTLLDVFGEVAKEYLTQQVIPETDAECRWNWRHGRCEPFCSCHLKLQWGDYHLGRACRVRPQKEEDEAVAPTHCNAPPDTRYTRTVEYTIEQRRVILEKARQSLENWKKKVQEETCSELPEKCPADDDYYRTWKQRLVCGHIPSPCDNEEESSFRSPLRDMASVVDEDNASATEEEEE